MTNFEQDAIQVSFLDELKNTFGRDDIVYIPASGTPFALLAEYRPTDPRDGHFGTLMAKLSDFADAGAPDPKAGDDAQVAANTYKVYKVNPPDQDGAVLIHLHVK